MIGGHWPLPSRNADARGIIYVSQPPKLLFASALSAYESRTSPLRDAGALGAKTPDSPVETPSPSRGDGIDMCRIAQRVRGPTPTTHKSGRRTAPGAAERPGSGPCGRPPPPPIWVSGSGLLFRIT